MPAGFLARAIRTLGIGVLLIGSLHYYIGSRLISLAGLPGWVAFLAWTILWLLLASIPAGFLSWRLLPAPVARRIRSISNLWIGIFGVLLSAVVLTDIARVIWLAVAQATPEQRATAGAVQALAIALLTVPAVLFGVRTARGPPKLEQIRLPIRRLGRGFDGFRMVQLSDIHVSESVPTRSMDAIVDRVNAMQADLVAITGDLIDGNVEDLRERVAPFGRLRAREGVFFVTGNHEYYHGVHAWEAEVKRLGITVLRNEHRVLRRGADALVLAGVPDYHGGQFDPAHESRPSLAFSGAPEDAPRILLAHQPRSVVEAATQRVDLQISGHTHGGQIFPFMFFVRLQQPVVSGLRKLHGVWVYTSRGTGYWGPPMRLGPSPEITEITLEVATSKF